MKKIITNIFRLIILLGLLTCLDMYSIYNRNKPIFIFEEKEENTNKIYNSILYDVYYCADLEKPQIKLKKAKYNCPVNNIKEEINNKKQAKLTLVGDLLFEQPFYDAIDSGEDKNKYFNRVKEYFQNDDLSNGNMEVVIVNDNLETSGTGYNFCAPEYIGDLVNNLDFEVLSTANNHAYDRGIAGINSTIDFFENNTNIVTVGTYKNKSDREDLRILNINDIKFGILSYTYGTNQKASNEEVNLIGYYKDPYSKKIT